MYLSLSKEVTASIASSKADAMFRTRSRVRNAGWRAAWARGQHGAHPLRQEVGPAAAHGVNKGSVFLFNRVADPDPNWIRIKSGQWIRNRICIQSGQWSRNRICIRNPDQDRDPGGQKWPTKVGKNQEISCFEVLDVLFSELKASFVTWMSFMEA